MAPIIASTIVSIIKFSFALVWAHQCGILLRKHVNKAAESARVIVLSSGGIWKELPRKIPGSLAGTGCHPVTDFAQDTEAEFQQPQPLP